MKKARARPASVFNVDDLRANSWERMIMGRTGGHVPSCGVVTPHLVSIMMLRHHPALWAGLGEADIILYFAVL